MTDTVYYSRNKDPLVAHYDTILRGSSRAVAATITSATTWHPLNSGTVSANATGITPTVIYLQPTDWAASGYNTKLRLLVGCLINDTAPANTMTFGLYPVTAMAGGAATVTLTLGTVTTGSTVAFASPAANSLTVETSSGDFAIPAAGFYVIAVVSSAAMAANSLALYHFALQVRNV